MSIFWSLKNRTVRYSGRAYWKTRSASIYLKTLFHHAETFAGFLFMMLDTMNHEYLHLFLKFELGKYSCSEKTVIEPIARELTLALARDVRFAHSFVRLFLPLYPFFDLKRFDDLWMDGDEG